MKQKLPIIIAILCFSFFTDIIQLKAQCSNSNLSIDWTFSTDVSGGDDIAWDIEPIDDEDQDTIKDDGFIAVGETLKDDSLKRQALIIRLNPDGTMNPPGWKVTRGGNQNDIAYAVQQASNGNIIVCGSTKSKTFGSRLNTNVWLFELTLNGDYVQGSEHEYGGSGNDNGYDIKVNSNGNYIIAGGTGNVADGDLSPFSATGINASGEYWVLAIDPNDYHIVLQNIYHGQFEDPDGTGIDFARSIMIDHNGQYLVSGYCTSCGEDRTQMQSMLIKIKTDGDLLWRKNFGDIPNTRDQGSHKIIETYNSQTSSYQYLLSGVNHPETCFNAHQHDSYVIKLKTNGDNIWTDGCQVVDGLTFGGSAKDDALDAVQTCDGGYLIAGETYSASNNFDVTCNHGSGTSDAWLYKLNSSGDLEWDASLGDVNNDEANSIKQVPDGSYIIAGDLGTGNSHGQDFYVVKFKIAECAAPSCSVPTGLSASSNGCKAIISWDMDPNVPSYLLRYKETSASSTTTISPAISPFIINGTVGGSDKYKWSLQSRCSKNETSDVSEGPPFVVHACKIDNQELAGNEVAEPISIYPNPSDGAFNLSCRLNIDLNENATINLLDQVGRVVFSSQMMVENGEYNQDLNLKELSAGFYWVRILGQGNSYQTKLIVQKP